MNPKKLFLSLPLILITFLLSSCDKMAVLEPMGLIAKDEKDLFLISLLLMLIIVVPVIVLTVVIAFKARASNLKAKYHPDWGHSTMLEVICWAFPIMIVAGLAVLTWFSTHRLDPYKPLDHHKAPIQIQAVSLNWRWLFIYPKENIATINTIEFPVDTPIEFLITSQGPMNGFHIPQLGGQIYAMAGMQTKLHLITDHPGTYRGQAINYSGDGFANMHFEAKAVTPAEFEAWVRDVKKSAKRLDLKGYNQNLVPDSEDRKIYYFSSVEPHLFDNIMMQLMMPMESNDNKSPHPSEGK